MFINLLSIPAHSTTQNSNWSSCLERLITQLWWLQQEAAKHDGELGQPIVKISI